MIPEIDIWRVANLMLKRFLARVRSGHGLIQPGICCQHRAGSPGCPDRPTSRSAWGDEGYKVIALIANAYTLGAPAKSRLPAGLTVTRGTISDRGADSSVSAPFATPRRVKVDSIVGYFGLSVDKILQPELGLSGCFCAGYPA